MKAQQQILLYNFKEDTRTQQLRRYLNRTGVTIRVVQPLEFLHPLGYLFEIPGFDPDPMYNLGRNFSEEMLVMANFPNKHLEEFLQFFRTNHLEPVALKAVLTPVTQHWNSIQLYEELSREHQAMKRTSTERV
jgi:hypothetical protein